MEVNMEKEEMYRLLKELGFKELVHNSPSNQKIFTKDVHHSNLEEKFSVTVNCSNSMFMMKFMRKGYVSKVSTIQSAPHCPEYFMNKVKKFMINTPQKKMTKNTLTAKFKGVREVLR
jgi:hypothetical protein